ncbi:MAG: ArnT family glycosyltransferase [Chloroflexota bacterium]
MGSGVSPIQVGDDKNKNYDLGRSDRFIAGLLMAFFLALYVLTGGGHGYSPDGEFAWRVARSISTDPDHTYIKNMQRGLDQWGFMVPLLAQPLVILGEPLAAIMPDKDYAIVDGHTYVLQKYRKRGLHEDAPTVGPKAPGIDDIYIRDNLTLGPATSMSIISFLSLSKDVPQGTPVAEVTLIDKEGKSFVFPIRAGIETSEWKRGKGAEDISHEEVRVASIWFGDTSGRNYFVEIPFGKTLEIRQFQVRHLGTDAHLHIRSVALMNDHTGSFEILRGNDRMWSERENNELFARLFYSPYNAIITAIGCVLLFALTRLLGYSQAVGVVSVFIYGLATLAWPYAKYDFSEPTLVMFVLTTLYLILRWDQERKDRLLLFAGCTALACVGTKYASGILIPLMALQIVLLQWEKYPNLRGIPQLLKPLFVFSAPFILVAAPALIYLSRRFGYYPSILEAWAGVQRGWLPLPMDIGLRGLLFSPGKSFFLYSPPMVLGLLSAIPFVRRHGVRTIGILTIIMVYFTIYAKKPAWHAGAGWGPRYQVLVIPLVMLILAPLIQKAIEQRHHWARYALIATFVLGMFFQMLAVTKYFEHYIGMFRHQIVTQLPDEGAQYGGADYYPYSAGLDDGNSTTATVMAWPFSPIFAHIWLLTADFLSLGPSSLQGQKTLILMNPPWKALWGIDAVPANPEYGLGFDFWSMKMKTDFPSFTTFLFGVGLIILLLEAILLFTGTRLISLLFNRSKYRSTVLRAWIVSAILILLIFDGIHFIL